MKKMDGLDSTVSSQQKIKIIFPVSPLAIRPKLHDDVDLFGNARITSDRSEISAVACKHSKPITWRVLAPNYQT